MTPWEIISKRRSDVQTITRFKGGTRQYEASVDSLRIPDLWHIIQAMKKEGYPIHQIEAIEECWYLCHDLKRHIEELG